MTVTLTVHNGNDVYNLAVATGSNLRQVLLDNGLSPYAALTQRANCGGRGLCATCGVWPEEDIMPKQWHDKIGRRFGYPRLSCQISVDTDMVVYLIPEKWVWGRRRLREK